MNFLHEYALLTILLSPLAGAMVILLLPDTAIHWIRRVAATATGLSLALTLFVCFTYNTPLGGMQFSHRIHWLTNPDISLHLGVDGLNIALALLHGLCAFTGTLVSFSIKERVKEYFLFYLALIGGVFGVFLSQDVFFFYVFYEMAVIPMYPLIVFWGSTEKEYASMKLTLYLTTGAVLALLGLLIVYTVTGSPSFDLKDLHEIVKANPLPFHLQQIVGLLLIIGFGVIAPMWPFHSWSPIGHAAAPSAVSMLHAGVLMKLGSYAILRIAFVLVPEGVKFWMPWVATLCTMNIVYGGLVAMAQRDLKFIIGYSSSSHMGYVLLGIATLTPIGVSGAVLLMFAHGLMTALAFALIGHVYDQAHTRMRDDFGGLSTSMPFIGTAFVMMTMASAGVPGFANFWAEVLILFGAWNRYPFQAMAGVIGLLITAVYLFRTTRSMFFGEQNMKWKDLKDAISPSERAPFLILLTALILVGCWPNLLLNMIQRGVGEWLGHLTP